MWCMIELEFRTICFALENVHNITYGADTINILTDHSPSVGLSKKCLDEIPKPRITSLFNKISHYNYQIKHISGEENVPTDVLSRLPTCTAEFQDINHFVPVQTITVADMQTRSGSLRVAWDLIEMAPRRQRTETTRS